MKICAGTTDVCQHVRRDRPQSLDQGDAILDKVHKAEGFRRGQETSMVSLEKILAAGRAFSTRPKCHTVDWLHAREGL